MRARWAPILLMAAIGQPGRASSPLQERFALTSGQVARALCVSGMQTTGEQVSLPASVVATERDPALDVVSVEHLGERSSRVRLACHEPGECLPFYAVVSAPPPAKFSAPAGSGGEFTMRAGARATLVIDDAHTHIQVRVISLENGMAGKRIRVSSMDHKQIYFGEVVSPSLLKGSF